MSHPILIIVVVVFVAAAATGATFLFARANAPETSQISGEERLISKKFFGTYEELPPIDKGQEMRPRW